MESKCQNLSKTSSYDVCQLLLQNPIFPLPLTANTGCIACFCAHLCTFTNQMIEVKGQGQPSAQLLDSINKGIPENLNMGNTSSIQNQYITDSFSHRSDMVLTDSISHCSVTVHILGLGRSIGSITPIRSMADQSIYAN